MKRISRKYAEHQFLQYSEEHLSDVSFLLYGYEVPVHNIIQLLYGVAEDDFRALTERWANSKDYMIVDEPEDLDG
jgi:hypothetical protein